LELGRLLLELLGWVIVWSGEDERDRLGREVAAAHQPLVSLRAFGDVKRLVASAASGRVRGGR